MSLEETIYRIFEERGLTGYRTTAEVIADAIGPTVAEVCEAINAAEGVKSLSIYGDGGGRLYNISLEQVATDCLNVSQIMEALASLAPKPQEQDASETNIEHWECTECGLPCRIVVEACDEKLPSHLKGQSRLRKPWCICMEATPNWVWLDEPPKPQEQQDAEDVAALRKGSWTQGFCDRVADRLEELTGGNK